MCSVTKLSPSMPLLTTYHLGTVVLRLDPRASNCQGWCSTSKFLMACLPFFRITAPSLPLGFLRAFIIRLETSRKFRKILSITVPAGKQLACSSHFNSSLPRKVPALRILGVRRGPPRQIILPTHFSERSKGLRGYLKILAPVYTYEREEVEDTVSQGIWNTKFLWAEFFPSS